MSSPANSSKEKSVHEDVDNNKPRQRDAELRDAQQRIAAVLAATEVGTWTYEIGPDRVVADTNLSRLFGLSPEDAAGGRIAAYLRAIHPEDRTRVEATIAAALRDGTRYVAEYRIVQRDGTSRTVIARGNVERDETGKALRMPGVVLDITDRVRAESERRELSMELARQARVLETVMSSIKDFAYIFDREGRFVFANKPLLDLWGLELKDAVGKDFFDLNYPAELAEKLQRQIQQVFEAKKPLTDKTPYTSPTGAGGFYEYIFTPVVAADGSVELVAGSTRDITEQHRIIEALQRSEENFRQLADTMPQIVWAAQPDGALDYYNLRWFEYINLSPGDMEGARWDHYIHPEDVQRAYESWAMALRDKTQYGIEFRVRRADGEYRWFLVRALPIHNAQGVVTRWFGTCTDVHEQRELQAKLAQSEARLRQLADTIPQLAWMAKPDGNIFWYNQRWYAYTGTTPEQVEGWGWQSVHDPEVLPKVLARWRTSIVSGEPFDMTFPIKGGDGEFRPFLTRVMPFRDEEGKIVLWFGTNTDVSEQRRLIKERDELVTSERVARRNAEQASRLKDEFLATLSHELRTPLNAILGWSQILRKQNINNKELNEGLAVIERNSRAQAQLIEDLLDMSRIISGKIRIDVQQIDLAEITNSAIESVRPGAEAKEIRLEKVLDTHVGPVRGDAARLQQVIWNLLSNAIKFTPKGGKVQVALEQVNSHVEITVTDTGIGIKPEFLPYVFERFRQADATTTRQHGGLGLGMAIVKNLVELHGGKVRAKSPGEGHGATFVIELPLMVIQPGPEKDARTSGPESVAADLLCEADVLLGVSVLVVDDDEDARDLISRVLQECKAKVIVATSANEAMELLKRERPSVIVSDIGMPEEDGYELIRQVRSLPDAQGGSTPAAALTAFARSEDRTRALRAGYQSHVAKPVEPSELVAVVASLASRTGPKNRPE
jgi:PAS domain S-box-containing protein